MHESVLSSLWLVPLVPIGVAAVLLPLAARLPRAFSGAAAVLGWLVSLGAAGHALWTELGRGEWEQLGFDGFVGALLVAPDPFGAPLLLGHPLSLLLALAIVLGGGLCLVDGLAAWGGGPRRERAPVSGGVLLGQLLLVGLCAFAALARSLDWLIAALVLASLVVTALLFAARPSRDELDAAGRLFVLHRVGDAALVLALLVLVSTFGELDPIAASVGLAEVGEWQRPVSGPLAGFPARQIVLFVGVLLLVGVASRLPLLPLPWSAHSATGAPASTLALVHGIGSYGLGLVLLLRVAPLLVRAHPLLPGLVLIAGATALVSALVAMAARDAVRIDLQLVHAYGALGVVAFGLGQYSAAVLIAVHLVLLAPLLGVTTGAAVEALQGQTDVFEMGGLWRSLRRTDLTRGLAVLSIAGIPGLASFFALERSAVEALSGPFGSRWAFALLAASAFALSLAAFRALHLVFTGEKPRGPAPAHLVEVPAWRWLLPLLVVFIVVAAGFVLAASEPLLALVNPGHQEPFLRFLEPSLRMSLPLPLSDDVTVAVGRSRLPVSRLALASIVGVLGLLGLVVSALLYRKGPTRLHERLAGSSAARALSRAFAEGLWLERAFARGLAAVVTPLAQVARTVVFNVLLGGLVTRPVVLGATGLRGLLGLVHNGDVQRALALALLLVVLLLALWGRS